VMRGLWRFLHDTTHPQVRDTSPDEVAFQVMDKVTIRKMENALMKILLLGVDAEGNTPNQLRPVTANLALVTLLEGPQADGSPRELEAVASGSLGSKAQGEAPDMQGTVGSASGLGTHSPGATAGSAAQLGGSQSRRRPGQETTQRPWPGQQSQQLSHSHSQPLLFQQQNLLPFQQQQQQQQQLQQQQQSLADPFADLKTAFEPPKEKLKTFNLKQIVTRNGTVLMNMLERLLETTEIDAHDVETDQTLLEFACSTGNMGLAKLCYRRGANLSAKTRKGDTPFNIVTRNKRYDMMEFLHTYGVKVNSADATGMSALHVAAAGDDEDAICRLLEWGADVNCRDIKRRTPIHIAARGGNMKATMLLLEVGADMNAKDEREYTAVAHAEAKNHFALMDRLVQLGGKGHGLQAKANDMSRSKSQVQMGELVISAGMLKSTSLGRIGKVAVKGMAGPLSPATTMRSR